MIAPGKPHKANRVFSNILAAALLLLASNAFAVDAINTTFFGNLAIEGYDPVAYFTMNESMEGNKNFEYQWKEATWRFTSQSHLDLFKSEPEKYAPQYGGYCAYAVSQNMNAGIDPDQFTIINDKLYLNYNKKINQKWLADRDQYILDADMYWPNILAR